MNFRFYDVFALRLLSLAAVAGASIALSESNLIYATFALLFAHFVVGWIYSRERFVRAISSRRGAVLFLAMLLFTGPAEHPELIQLRPRWNQTIYALLFAAFTLSLWRREDSSVARFLRLPLFVYLGRMSFSLYLVHLFTWEPAAAIAESFPLPLIVWRFVLTVLAGLILWYAIEAPSHKIKRKYRC